MSAKIVIGLRGLIRGNIHWAGFPDVLKQVAPDIYFLPLEMPGNGIRSSEFSYVDPHCAVEDIRMQLQSFKEINSKFQFAQITVLAISLGGMLALKWAELYPSEIDQLIIVNSSLKPLSPFYHRLFPKNYFNIFKTMTFGSNAEKEKLILNLTTKNINLRKKYLPQYVEFASHYKIKNSNFIRQLILASRIKVNKSLLIKPLFICSLNDNLVSWTCSKKLSDQFDGTLIINDLAGHDLSFDQPVWLAEKINSLQSQQQNH